MNYTCQRAVSCGFLENISISILANSRPIVANVFQIVLKPPLEVQSHFLNFGLIMFLKLSLARHHSKRALSQTLFIVFFPLYIFNQSSLLIFAQSVQHQVLLKLRQFQRSALKNLHVHFGLPRNLLRIDSSLMRLLFKNVVFTLFKLTQGKFRFLRNESLS